MTTTALIDRIQDRHGELQFGRAAKHLLALPVYGLGWLLGKIWWLVSFWASAFMTGFTDGKT